MLSALKNRKVNKIAGLELVTEMKDSPTPEVTCTQLLSGTRSSWVQAKAAPLLGRGWEGRKEEALELFKGVVTTISLWGSPGYDSHAGAAGIRD